jgi:hypothetical protein
MKISEIRNIEILEFGVQEIKRSRRKIKKLN